MKEDNRIVPYAATSACGLIVYLAITAEKGRNEAWDDASYYSIGIPLVCIVAFFIGYRFRHFDVDHGRTANDFSEKENRLPG